MNDKIKMALAWLGLLLLALFLYYPVFLAGFVWDDDILFVKDTSLVDGKLSWEIISRPVLVGTSYFRPLIFLSWWSEFHLAGLNPKLPHIINFVVYYVNIILVYLLSFFLAKKFNYTNILLMAFIASLLYAIHPALIETTAWVSGRFDQYVTFFCLLASIFFVAFSKGKARFSVFASVLVGFSFLLGLFSKELAIVLPLIFLCLYFALNKDSSLSYKQLVIQGFSQYCYLVVSIIFVLVGYFVLRIKSMSQVYHNSLDSAYIEDYWYDLIPIHAFADYFKQAFLPFYSISPMHPIVSYNFLSFEWLILVVVAMVVLFSVIYQAFVKRQMFAWLGLCALISILLVLHIIPLNMAGNLIQERFMTLGMAYLCIAVVFFPYSIFFNQLKVSTQAQKAILLCTLVFWSGLSIMTIKSIVPLWSNDNALWYWLYQSYPEDGIVRYNHWYSILEEKKQKEVIQLIEKYYKGNGMAVDDQLLYAQAKLELDDAESLPYYQGAIYALPKFHEPNPQLAYKKVIRFKHKYGLYPSQYVAIYFGYAMAELRYSGDFKTALEQLNIARAYINTQSSEALDIAEVALLYLSGDKKLAISKYQEIIKNPRIKQQSIMQINGEISRYCKNYPEKSVMCKKEVTQDNSPFK